MLAGSSAGIIGQAIAKLLIFTTKLLTKIIIFDAKSVAKLIIFQCKIHRPGNREPHRPREGANAGGRKASADWPRTAVLWDNRRVCDYLPAGIS